MEAKELRIGNWVKYKDGRQVIKIDLGDFCYIERQGTEDYKPIPLTEEWLLKFGFEKGFEGHEDTDFSKENFNMLSDYGGQGITISKDKNIKPFMYCGYYNNEIGCEFVHQLQNLYFALTGEELEIN